MAEWDIRLEEISLKDGLARSQEVGRVGAGPSTGQQPLPGFLTALLFEARVLGHPGNGRHHFQQRRGNCLNVSAPPLKPALELEMGAGPRQLDLPLGQAMQPPPCVCTVLSPPC